MSDDPTNKPLSLGLEATRIASRKSDEWQEDAMRTIRKKVLDMAEQGLFHATLRFEDTLPQDPVNQRMLLKVLADEHLKGEFSNQGDTCTLTLEWGNHFFTSN